MKTSKMEPRKAQKRPSDMTILNGSSDSPTQEKRPRLSDEGSGDYRKEDDVTLLSSQNTLEYKNSYLIDDGDTLWLARTVAENGVTDLQTNTVAEAGISDEVDSQRTVVLSDNAEEAEEGNKREREPDSDTDTYVRMVDGVGHDERSVVLPDSTFGADTCIVRKDAAEQSEEAHGSSTGQTEQSPYQLWKDTSLVRDVDAIAAIIPDVDSSVVFDTLVRHRGHPDRLNIATAAILDSAPSFATGGGGVGKEQAVTSTSHVDETSACSAEHSHVIAQETTNDTISGNLYEDVKKVVVKVIDRKADACISATEVYLLLEENKGKSNRVDLVCNLLLEKYAVCDKDNQTESDDALFDQAMKLSSEFPHVDPSEIYELLERAGDQRNRLQIVKDKLLGQASSTTQTCASSCSSAAKPPIPKEDSASNDPLVKNDRVYHDMRIIAKMFPEKDQNELYAMVEAHYYKPDRVQVVIEELLREERNSQENGSSQPLETSMEVVEVPASSPVKEGQKNMLSDYVLQAEVAHLRDIFPDCDPNYLYECLDSHKDTPDRVKAIATRLFEKKDYPRLKDMMEKYKAEAKKKLLQNLNFTMEDFLAKFPDPREAFITNEKDMKENYKEHVAAQLKHEFPEFKSSYVQSVVQQHKHHLLPIMRELEHTRMEVLARGRHSKKLRQVPKEEPLVYPDTPDEYFFYELWYTQNERKVTEYFEEKEAVRQVKVEQARACNELYECGCCYEDECLFEEMNACADGHLFCRQCIVRSVEAAFGEGKTTFPCLSGVCEHPIPLSVLRQVLPSAILSKVLCKMQEEEVRQADIPDLVDCPFCSFATIMSDPSDRVFRCLNPECLRDSCRLCREPNHVPLKCEEVEKQTETDMRTFIEKRVTEAMLRKCHRCGKHFVKDMGCNKMTCICGATSCYVCREPDINYDHFNGGRCAEVDMDKLHKREMERAAEEARKKYLQSHPEARGLTLKYDPQEHIDTAGYRGIPPGDYEEYRGVLPDDYEEDIGSTPGDSDYSGMSDSDEELQRDTWGF